MAKFRTHYDNLKVARNAPDAVIRAAYKALMQKYHPDKYDGDPKEAERIAKVIQASFNILSDPVKRAEHDEWIRQQERKVKEEQEFQDVDDGASSNPFDEQPRGYGQGYYQPPPDPPQNNSKESQPDAAPSIYATFWKRAAAAVLDGIILILPLASVTTPLYLMLSGTGGDPSEVESQKQALALVLASFYYAILESSSWQATPGKRIMGIKVVDLHGNPITFWRASGRYWGKLPSAFILGMGYLMAAFTQHKQTLHDKMANCLVVIKTASPDDVCKAGPYPEMGMGVTVAIVIAVTIVNPIALSIGIPAYMDVRQANNQPATSHNDILPNIFQDGAASLDQPVPPTSQGVDLFEKFGVTPPSQGRQSAQQQYELGNRAYDAQNYSETIRWFHLAAEQGHADAQNSLGTMYYDGRGVTENKAEAVRWYLLAAEQGNVLAQSNLGAMYDRGEGVAQNYVEAARWRRLAAEQGYASAQHILGIMYRNGEGVAQNYVEAAKWHRLAAEQGYVSAQFALGVLYHNGSGVIQSDAEAVMWYRLAAEQGHANAQFILGVMYDNGEGVAQSDAEAVKWYRLAAEQGNAKARNNLNALYGRVR